MFYLKYVFENGRLIRDNCMRTILKGKNVLVTGVAYGIRRALACIEIFAERGLLKKIVLKRFGNGNAER